MASARWTENGIPVILALIAGCLSCGSAGQELMLGSASVPKDPFCPSDTILYSVTWRITHKLDYSLSCNVIHYLNWKQGDPANTVSLLHQLQYRWQIEKQGSLQFTGTFTHDLGMLWFPDSLTRIRPDDNSLETNLFVSLPRRFSLSVLSRMSTAIFNTYTETGSPGPEGARILASAFLTPFIWNFSGGIGWTLTGFGRIDLGLSSARLTWVKNRAIFRAGGPCFGVAEGKNHLFEVGLSFHMLVDREFADRFRWTCDLLVFRNYHKSADLSLKNILTARITGFLKITLQSKIVYERDISRHLQTESLISLGFGVGL